jgi:uncharacterized integral membrane protein (TIGR00697 family)
MSASAGAGLSRREATFAALVALFGVVLVLTNIVGVKLFVIFPDGRPGWLPGEGGLTLTSGIITYPLTFLLTDLVSELWGRKRANFMVVLGFCLSLVMLGIVFMARALPPSDLWANDSLAMGPDALQLAFEASFAYPASLLFASMTAYLVAQLLDVRLYHFWWRLTKGRHMWIRNNGSTSISQLVDTIIVNSIFLRWAFDMAWSDIGGIIVAVYVCKLVMALLDTPLIYLGRALLRRFLGIESDVAPGSAPLA